MEMVVRQINFGAYVIIFKYLLFRFDYKNLLIYLIQEKGKILIIIDIKIHHEG